MGATNLTCGLGTVYAGLQLGGVDNTPVMASNIVLHQVQPIIYSFWEGGGGGLLTPRLGKTADSVCAAG